MKRYYYAASISDFLKEASPSIIGKLSDSNVFELTLEQKNAWSEQIKVLKASLSKDLSAHIFFEYTIPRMGKRCDCILIAGSKIIILEFKAGSSRYTNQDKNQALDYALDLKNFHKQSHDKQIIPILVATRADNKAQDSIVYSHDQVSQCLVANSNTLTSTIVTILKQENETGIIDVQKWTDSPYQPTPTIIEAAKALYKDHSVENISRKGASGANLDCTARFIDQVITRSKANHSKSICFITGVPGAGKTLAGLNIATECNQTDKKEHAVFLSGNGPLVSVLKEALATDKKHNDHAAGLQTTLTEARRETSTFIQNIHHFRDDHLKNDEAPVEQVVIFDEAQRAWTAQKASKFLREKRGIADFNQSEPSFLLNIMDKHQDWCVVVALIGGGQEINDGEAGLPEWLHALKELGDDWTTYYSPDLNTDEYTRGSQLSELLPPNAQKSADLHLSICIRSFRAKSVSAFVNCLISNNPIEAEQIISNSLSKFPIYITRNIDTAKKWITQKQRGSERMGLIASAGAKRLVPHGIHMKVAIEAENWFLADEDDIRSSNFLESAASQFDVQGLEVDWALVCWDADLRREEW